MKVTEFNFIATQQTEITKMALDLNYYGKRLASSRQKVADQIADRMFKGNRVADIIAYLDATKPAKAAKEKEEKEPIEPTFNSSNQHFETAPKVEAGSFIVFSVQNNAPICAPAMATAKMLAASLNAELLPVSCSYMIQPTDEADHMIIKTEAAPLWIGDDNSLLILNGDVIPTAKKPISNARLMSGDRRLTVLPHPKQQAESLPRAKGMPERWAVTTGTLCEPRYKTGRAGAEASADHIIGFTVIHEDGTFDQVQLDNQGCGFYRGMPINEFGFADPMGDAVIVAGDIHSEKLDGDEFNNLITLCNQTAAAYVVLHDLHDFTSRNHHNRGSGLFLASQMGRTVADDVDDAAGVLQSLLDDTEATIVIVNSNHDRALDRWLEETDPRQDPINLPLWCDLQKPRYETALEGGKDNQIPLERALKLVAPSLDYSRIKFLNRDEPFMVHGVELSNHGDCGINGARGGYTAFERLGGSFAIGHSHSGYKNGKRVIVSGVTGSFDMGYNVGASSWSHSHAVICNDGSMQIIA